MRPTFGSILIQHGASLAYVKDQMGHSSIQVTVDTYGHLIPGADVSWVDRLDAEVGQPKPSQQQPNQQQNATQAQQPAPETDSDLAHHIERFGGGGWTRTNDLGIMRPSL